MKPSTDKAFGPLYFIVVDLLLTLPHFFGGISFEVAMSDNQSY